MSLQTPDNLHVQSNNEIPPPSSTVKKDHDEDLIQINENTDHQQIPPPTPCRIKSPKSRDEPASSKTRMKQHNVIDSLFKSSPSSPPSISLPPTLPFTKETSRENDQPVSGGSFSSSPSSKKKQYTSHQHKHHQSRTHSSAASLVVCGVDGTVFTLDAYTGQLKGMFASGPALVFSSDAFHQDEDLGTSVVSAPKPWKERVVPGLDGRLYNLFEPKDQDEMYQDAEREFSACHADNDDFLDELCSSQDSDNGLFNPSESDSSRNLLPKMDKYKLQPLPITVLDVVESPISTCRPIMDVDEAFEGVQRQQCGIVVGSKKTTVYAIDPMTGKVKWTQDPHGGAGAKGFTTSRPAEARGKPTVLLQREDYTVRHLDTDGGEVWKVELGRFSALDFDIGAHSRKQNDVKDDEDDPFVVGSRGRGAAAAAAKTGVGLKEKLKSQLPPILGGSKKFGSFREESEFESDIFELDYQHPNFREIPSIAFGEDGTSILAIDSISGELLWKRQIESVVAAVYGVGKDKTWVSLDVIDESEVFTRGHQQGSNQLPSSSLSSQNGGGLVPYGVNLIGTDQSHRIGRHRNHLFVSSRFDPLGISPPPFPESIVEDETPDYIDEHEGFDDMLLPPKQTPIFSQAPYSMPVDVTPPVSHRTKHGLYLTWSMVSAILALLCCIVVYARLYYLRQKQKWENTPTLTPATAPNSYEDNVAADQSTSPKGNFLPPASFVDEKKQLPSFPGTPWWRSTSADNINTNPPSRSLSLGAIGPQSNNIGKAFLAEKEKVPPSPKHKVIPLFRDAEIATKSLAGVKTATPTISRSLTVPDDDQLKQPDIDNIDGVPLVRYSRYRSEFKELSPLGRGGFGTVFRCENALDSRHYAIKKIWIKSQLMDGKVTKHFSQKLHRVLREVKILALLDHPNIVRYYTAWLEVDDREKIDDDESHTTNSKASPSFFSGFGSTSRGPSVLFKAGGSVFSKSSKGIATYMNMQKNNPLGWNNFGSFRLDESKSASKLSNVNENSQSSSAEVPHGEDLGFVWERSNGNSLEQLSPVKQTIAPIGIEETMNENDDLSSSSSSGVSSVDSKESTEEKTHNLNVKPNVQLENTNGEQNEGDAKKEIKQVPLFTTERRHVLYIQMQLCSVQTLADFLGNRQARLGNLSEEAYKADSYAVDIPFALRLFSQISHGVNYVHQQGLIHRDLKPQNCFIDDAGNAKVGDFGLSRESSTVGSISAFDDGLDDTDGSPVKVDTHDGLGEEDENTAGVGTRAYASPEQMKGSNYGASTDVYSLGIILFEMCYPLYTTHERYKEFSGIKKGLFPKYWDSHIKTSFPSLHNILVQMISQMPSERPSAADVSEHIDKMLAEYSIQSIDKSWVKKGVILLRVEANEAEGVLTATMKLIKGAAPNAVILQYGLRGQATKAIMEFAIEIPDDEKVYLERISSSLRGNAMIVRQLSNH